MQYLDFTLNNLKAVESTKYRRVDASEVAFCNQRTPYRGFINCVAADGEDSFVMFNNADDIVAAHYFYAGPSSFETDTLRLWAHLAKQAKWIYDVGAFTGVFSLAAVAANPDCFVMAFEPSNVTWSRLLVNVLSNKFDDRIAPIRFGLASEQGEMLLRHRSGVYVLSSDESFLEERVPDAWFTERVHVMSLDHLLENQDRYRRDLIVQQDFDGVDLVKIDVEGAEVDVLQGMRECIRRYTPAVIVEILDTSRMSSVIDLFGPAYRHRNAGPLLDRPQGANVLFIHEDKVGLLSDFAW